MADKKAKVATKKVDKVVANAPKNIDYKIMTVAEIDKAIATLRDDVLTLKRGTIVGDVQNVRAYNGRRKELARALTARAAKNREDK